MAYIEKDNYLIGDFGELLFEHMCQKKNYAYLTLKEIYKSLTPEGILNFRKGEETIKIKIPQELIPEISRICNPSYKKGDRETTVYDYLSVSLWYAIKLDGVSVIDKDYFNWVEIKANTSQLTENQIKTSKECKIPIQVFRFHFDLPDKIKYEWEGSSINKDKNHLHR